MGPQQLPGERISTYRIRYARYCLRWFIALLIPLVVLVVFRPSVRESEAAFVLMVLYVGLPLGTATAGIAGLGFLLGALWARKLEDNTALSTAWPKVKVGLLMLILLPLIAFAFWVFAQGLINQEVLVFSRRNSGRIAWDEDPMAYLITMALWGAVPLGLGLGLFRLVRRTYAT